MKPSLSKKILDELTYQIIGSAIEVQKALGPGLLESVYQRCLFHEFRLRNIYFQSQLSVPINYKGLVEVAELRCDFYVDDCICVELKATDAIIPVYEAQLLTYMKLLQSPKGILINFNSTNLFENGQRTFVNELFRSLPDK